MNLNTFFTKSNHYSFLTGAGISHQYPANLPLAKTFLYSILEILNIDNTLKNDIKKTIDSSNLRFEQFIEKLKLCYDENLHILDLFILSNCPNPIHFFLTYAIKHGHYVLTTNFDKLIETAAMMVDVPIKTLFNITDFGNKNVESLNAIWKLHGSLVDESNNNVRESVITTISQIGKHGEAFSFAKEKSEFLHYLLKKTDVVILGYSGSDDYDIIPAIAKIKTDRKLLWVMHNDHTSEIKIFNIVEIEKKVQLDAIKMLLSYGNWKENQIFITISNTLNVIEELNLLLFSEKLFFRNIDVFEPPKYFFEDWKFEYALENWRNYMFLAEIYSSIGYYDKSINFYLNALSETEELNEIYPQINLNSHIAVVYITSGRFESSLEHLEKNMSIYESLTLPYDKNDLINLAICYRAVGNAHKANQLLKKLPDNDETSVGASVAFEKAKLLESKDIELSLQLFKKAFSIHQKLGQLIGMSNCLLAISRILHNKKHEYRLALYYISKGLRISKLTKNYSYIADFCSFKSRVYLNMRLLSCAYENTKYAFHLYKELKAKDGLIKSISIISDIFNYYNKITNILEVTESSLVTSNIVTIYSEQIGATHFKVEEDIIFPTPEELMDPQNFISKEEMSKILDQLLKGSSKTENQLNGLIASCLSISSYIIGGRLTNIYEETIDFLEDTTLSLPIILLDKFPKDICHPNEFICEAKKIFEDIDEMIQIKS